MSEPLADPLPAGEAAAPEDGPIETGGALRGALFEAFCHDVDEERAASEGERVGRYRVLAELGRGGMADVFLAERADGAFEQRVALKFPRGGSADAEGLRRFERERRILATLEHPQVARLLDGGLDERGRPFIALEYVDGQPLDRYCDERRLGVAARVALLASVARAVAYAHHHLVVHRDLKPANVLVTAAGQVKLLDFGIAKLLGPEEGAASDLTVVAAMTPAYASPEQVRGETLTTASDVYQLGLLLYELLAGRRAQRVGGTSLAELERAVCLDQPAPPSAAAADPQACAATAAARGTTPAGLVRTLRGDLDTIVMKAVAKEPARRYGSAEELAADLEAHLDGRPIAARADSRLYRLGRLASRHRLALAFAGAVLVLVSGWLFTLVSTSRELRRQRDQAVAASQRAADVQRVLLDLIRETDPWSGGRQDPQARQLLDRVSLRVQRDLAGEPEVQADLLDTLGEGRLRMGDVGRARADFEQVLRLRLARFGPSHESVADSLHDFAAAEWALRRFDLAEPLFDLALEKYRGACGEACPRVVSMLSYLGTVYLYTGRLERAEGTLRDALARRRQVMGPEHASVGVSLNNLALALAARGRLAEAESLHREALELRRRKLGRHPDTSQSLGNLASLLLKTGEPSRLAEAEALAREAVAIRKELLAPDHPDLAQVLSLLAEVLSRRGAGAEALQVRRQAQALRPPEVTTLAPAQPADYARLAELFAQQGDRRAAGVLLDVSSRAVTTAESPGPAREEPGS